MNSSSTRIRFHTGISAISIINKAPQELNIKDTARTEQSTQIHRMTDVLVYAVLSNGAPKATKVIERT